MYASKICLNQMYKMIVIVFIFSSAAFNSKCQREYDVHVRLIIFFIFMFFTCSDHLVDIKKFHLITKYPTVVVIRMIAHSIEEVRRVLLIQKF